MPRIRSQKSFNHFQKLIENRIEHIRTENRDYINKGDMFRYRNNCNILRGIAFVMNKLKDCIRNDR